MDSLSLATLEVRSKVPSAKASRRRIARRKQIVRTSAKCSASKVDSAVAFCTEEKAWTTPAHTLTHPLDRDRAQCELEGWISSVAGVGGCVDAHGSACLPECEADVREERTKRRTRARATRAPGGAASRPRRLRSSLFAEAVESAPKA